MATKVVEFQKNQIIPFEYGIAPRSIEEGDGKITLHLKNIGTKDLTDLEVRLHSLDTFYLLVIDPRVNLQKLEPGEEKTIDFKVKAKNTTDVLVQIEAKEEEGGIINWESPWKMIRVKKQGAEIISMIITDYDVKKGQKIQVETKLRGAFDTGHIYSIEVYVDTPEGEYKNIGKFQTKKIKPEEIVRYSVDYVPKEPGMYAFYSYLYEGENKVGRTRQVLFVE